MWPRLYYCINRYKRVSVSLTVDGVFIGVDWIWTVTVCWWMHLIGVVIKLSPGLSFNLWDFLLLFMWLEKLCEVSRKIVKWIEMSIEYIMDGRWMEVERSITKVRPTVLSRFSVSYLLSFWALLKELHKFEEKCEKLNIPETKEIKENFSFKN